MQGARPAAARARAHAGPSSRRARGRGAPGARTRSKQVALLVSVASTAGRLEVSSSGPRSAARRAGGQRHECTARVPPNQSIPHPLANVGRGSHVHAFQAARERYRQPAATPAARSSCLAACRPFRCSQQTSLGCLGAWVLCSGTTIFRGENLP